MRPCAKPSMNISRHERYLVTLAYSPLWRLPQRAVRHCFTYETRRSLNVAYRPILEEDG